MVVLTGNGNRRALGRLHRRRNRGKGRRDDDVAARRTSGQRQKRGKERTRLGLSFEHFPVPCHHPAARRTHRLVSASTPGSLRPPKNSSEAPPPVEMWEILSVTPD